MAAETTVTNVLVEHVRNAQPSNALYRGEVHDFPTAMRTVMAACDAERALAEKINGELGVEPEHAMFQDTALWNDYHAAAVAALMLWSSAMQEAEKRVIATLRAKDNPDFLVFADALESGDYSSLAI